ncbi:MAG: D-sedoheptulose 7-phosphate isomerase [Gallionellaceae bacterium]|nr:D-sedoheptulose 7-phosphate isomerase [Gallionellaceae bacterium]
MIDVIERALEEHAGLLDLVRRDLMPDVAAAATILIECSLSGGKIMWCGNGGSAADAQHLAAELIGRFKRERQPIASIALTTDTSILTCVGNDYGFSDIFSRQVEALAAPGDVLVLISTSGNSENVLRAAQAVKSRGVRCIGLLGCDGGKLKALCDLSLVIPSRDTARIQEMHITVGHILCDLLEANVARI